MSRAELERALRAVLDTLREYLGDLVLIGGWVPYLHFTYGDVATPDAAVSLTAEGDLMQRGDVHSPSLAARVKQPSIALSRTRQPSEGPEVIIHGSARSALGEVEAPPVPRSFRAPQAKEPARHHALCVIR